MRCWECISHSTALVSCSLLNAVGWEGTCSLSSWGLGWGTWTHELFCNSCPMGVRMKLARSHPELHFPSAVSSLMLPSLSCPESLLSSSHTSRCCLGKQLQASLGCRREPCWVQSHLAKPTCKNKEHFIVMSDSTYLCTLTQQHAGY